MSVQARHVCPHPHLHSLSLPDVFSAIWRTASILHCKVGRKIVLIIQNNIVIDMVAMGYLTHYGGLSAVISRRQL